MQDHCGDFRRRVGLALRHHGDAVALRDYLIGHHLHLFVHFAEAPAHEPLDGIDGVFRIGYRLPFGNLSDQAFARLRDAYNGRRGSRAFLVGDHDWFAPLHNRNYGIRGSQIDADNLTHGARSSRQARYV